MKKALLALVVIALVVWAAYAYVTQPVSAPTQEIGKVAAKLPAGSATSTVFRISQTDSLVSFNMNELLNGKPKLVVGTTTQIAGDIAFEGDKVVMSELKLNAKTFVTDSPQRNGALARLILKSENPANEFITFVPTSNTFEGPMVPGKEISFNVTGDLTISGVTKPTTFAVKAKVTGDVLFGSAQTRIKRSDFGLTIPNLSFVANVDDEFPIWVTITAKQIMR